MDSGARARSVYGALDAFLPAVLALGGDLDRAARLQQSGQAMWRLHGIEPEALDYRKMEVTSGGYQLRPEIVESAYYLHHYIRDVRWRAMGREFFDDFVRNCRTDTAYAAIKDVRTMEKRDSMESFVLAETFKYYWLLFSPPSVLDFDGVVFNTEAHPLRRTWKD
jgi:mannosidase alpha-like ER degradation enhancer 2